MPFPVETETSGSAVLARNNVTVLGNGPRAMVFAHGLGCGQGMWRLVAPAFADGFQVVLFDHVGADGSDLSAYEPAKYSTLNGYAADLIEICQALNLRQVVFVGHSVSAMIGVLASIAAPELFETLILIGPSARYINDGSYHGGFERSDIDDLLALMDHDYRGWAGAFAPLIMGNSDRPDLAEELRERFCHTDPDIVRDFARLTFTSDNRDDLRNVLSRVLILQCTDDIIAPLGVGAYVQSQIAGSVLQQLEATGHCPNLSAPEETIAAIRAFV